MLMSNELKLTHTVTDEDLDGFEIELDAQSVGCPLLTLSFDYHGKLSVKSLCVQPGDLEQLAMMFQDWAEQLRRYQSQMLTNNLFEGD